MYKYICPLCGNRFEENHDKLTSCRLCNYWYLVINYHNSQGEVNKELFKKLTRNIESETQFQLKCNECQSVYRMFNDSIPGATCHCGGYLQEKDTNSNWVERLIDFRKTKRYSQHLLAMFIGVSQSQLSKMAKGETPVTPQVIKYLEKNGG